MASITGLTPHGNCAPPEYLGNDTYACRPIPDDMYVRLHLYNQWFLWYARIDGNVGETLHIRLCWPEHDPSKVPSWVQYGDSEDFVRAASEIIFVSEDEKSWKRIENVTVEGSDLLFDVTLTSPTMYASVNLYYTMAMLNDLRSAMAASPYAERKVIGKAWSGDAMELFVVTDRSVPTENKQIIYMQGLQHANEFTGATVCDALLRYLADGLDTAGELLKKYEFHILPVMSVSSWLRGKAVHLTEKNPNRDWEEFTLPETSAVRDYLLALPKKPVIVLDMHNGWSSYENDGAGLIGLEGASGGFVRFDELIRSDCDYLPPERTLAKWAPGTMLRDYSCKLGAYGYTMEFSHHNIYDRALGKKVPISQAHYRRYARQLAAVIDKFLTEEASK